jgi:hypothetical protein
MTSLFQDPVFMSVRHVNAEIFAVEQLCRQYGFEDVRHALYRVRANELGNLETRVRASHLGVVPPGREEQCVT